MPDQLSRLIVEEVAAAEAPIPAARLAQIARARLPGIEVHGLGHGSWKKLLDALSLPGVQIVRQALVGYALDPAHHSLPELASEPAHPLRASVALLLDDAVGLPALKPAPYRAQLEGLAQALSCGVNLSACACAREGVKMEDSDRAALIGWMTGEG